MTTTHPDTRTAACGECWTYAEHLPSCSAAPEYGPGDPAPAVLVFDRDAQRAAEPKRPYEKPELTEIEDEGRQDLLDEAFRGDDDRRPTEVITIRISRDARNALDDAIGNGYPLMFWGDPAELLEAEEDRYIIDPRLHPDDPMQKVLEQLIGTALILERKD